MRDRRFTLKIAAASFAAFFASVSLLPTAPAHAADEEAAKAFVVGMIDQAISVLKLPVDQKDVRKNRFEALLLDNFDMPAITRLVVGRYWRRASDDQKDMFSGVFREHIVNVYTSQLGVYTNEEINIKKIIPRDDRDVIVFTEVFRGEDNPALRLDWLVREKSTGGFSVVDVAAEGVSMLTTKRSEFTAVIAREGIDGLIARLQEMNSSG